MSNKEKVNQSHLVQELPRWEAFLVSQKIKKRDKIFTQEEEKGSKFMAKKSDIFLKLIFFQWIGG